MTRAEQLQRLIERLTELLNQELAVPPEKPSSLAHQFPLTRTSYLYIVYMSWWGLSSRRAGALASAPCWPDEVLSMSNTQLAKKRDIGQKSIDEIRAKQRELTPEQLEELTVAKAYYLLRFPS